ncbi:hypothetical protein QR680_016870 [Steinernema hermaphroditum]|uniref:Anion exchange protein n=1 Tax=Steinernema hermaphroditum TaxID=289476 RepID=A0AA39HCJ1_9BILA|nr:hypothetical protein QR680_016870 [Steinernema hermaphroditum]
MCLFIRFFLESILHNAFVRHPTNTVVIVKNLTENPRSPKPRLSFPLLDFLEKRSPVDSLELCRLPKSDLASIVFQTVNMAVTRNELSDSCLSLRIGLQSGFSRPGVFQVTECLKAEKKLEMNGGGHLNHRNADSAYGNAYCVPRQNDEKNALLEALTTAQSISIGRHNESASDKVRKCLLDNTHSIGETTILSEMMELCTNQTLFWKQSSRCIKYEQNVEGEGTRLSKPHLTLLKISALLQLKHCLKKGPALLDLNVQTYSQLVEKVVNSWSEQELITGKEKIAAIRNLLKAKKLHLANGKMKTNNETTNNGSDEKVDSSSDDQEEAKERNLSRNFSETNEKLIKKLPTNTECAVMLVGNCHDIDRPLTMFVRLNCGKLFHPELPDHPFPVRFLFVCLTPHENYPNETVELGRSMCALFADDVFKTVALVCDEQATLSDAIEDFLGETIIVPPGNCDTSTRWEPDEKKAPKHRNIETYLDACGEFERDQFFDYKEEGHGDIVRTGRLFGGLVDDLKRKKSVYVSEFTEFFKGRLSQSFAVVIFLFFANLTSIITFGAVMERVLHHQMASIENILCGGISGVVFALFSGQPLNILSATGPTLVFEKILYEFCLTHGWEFLTFRLWVGIWIAVYLLILVATDMSALVGLITRFTEEAFATLISVVFIIQAFQKLGYIGDNAPITTNVTATLEDSCRCIVNGTIEVPFVSVSGTVLPPCTHLSLECLSNEFAVAEGRMCNFKPDVYMFSILLTIGTFVIAYGLNVVRNTSFFSTTIRNTLSDFGVVIAIVIMTFVSHYVDLDIPILKIPSSFRPTINRSWLVDPSHAEFGECLLAALPAAFYTILIVMDQQITAVIINRKDNKLQKGHGYHLDLLIIAFLILVCSFLGLPFYVAATVLSVMHVDALRIQTECTAPGEKPQFLGVKEQRVTAIIAHLLIGLSVFLTPIIKLVPLPVLIGIFLYMGVVSLMGQQIVQRFALLFMSIKHQPDYPWIRNVRMKRVHLFTVIQLLSIGSLFAVKYTKGISMIFPMMLVLMVLIRMFALDKLFTKKELQTLDDHVPSFHDVMQPGRKKLLQNSDSHYEDEIQALKKASQVSHERA